MSIILRRFQTFCINNNCLNNILSSSHFTEPEPAAISFHSLYFCLPDCTHVPLLLCSPVLFFVLDFLTNRANPKIVAEQYASFALFFFELDSASTALQSSVNEKNKYKPY